MRQGSDESDSAYLKRFRVNLDTFCSAGRKHILCSPDLIEAVDEDSVTEAAKKAEENKFKVIVFLKRSDPTRHSSFLTELQNSSHLDHDEYPVSETAAMDLMVRRSSVFSSSLIQKVSLSGTTNVFRRPGRGRGCNFVQNSGRGSSNNRPPAGTVLIAGVDRRTCNVLCFQC